MFSLSGSYTKERWKHDRSRFRLKTFSVDEGKRRLLEIMTSRHFRCPIESHQSRRILITLLSHDPKPGVSLNTSSECSMDNELQALLSCCLCLQMLIMGFKMIMLQLQSRQSTSCLYRHVQAKCTGMATSYKLIGVPRRDIKPSPGE